MGTSRSWKIFAALMALALAGCTSPIAEFERKSAEIDANLQHKLAEIAQQEAERQKTASAECNRRGGVQIGMTREQVYASCWGKPQRINTTITAGGQREQFVYRGSNYLYLDNGILRSIQTSDR